MITEISLQNFKIFKDKTTFPLNKLNLLTGVNGGGKSTLLQSLLLMRQSIEHDERTTNIIFNGSCVELGTFMDVKNLETSRKEDIVFGFNFLSEKHPIKYSIKENVKNDSLGKFYQIQFGSQITQFDEDSLEKLMGVVINEKEKKATYLMNLIPMSMEVLDEDNFSYKMLEANNFEYVLTFQNIHYIAADRIGPKSYYEKTTLGKFPNVGPRGEHTANILYRLEDKLVNDKLYLGKDAKTLMQQTEEWLKNILGGAKLELKGKEREHTVLNLLFNTRDSEGRYRPSNVGFGYTYILPIVVSGLIAKSGEILIVENPEAHLHPKAQSELTKFLALVASCGVQVFIESHSEHVLNAIRVVTLQKEIDIKNDEVSVLYFQNDKKEPFVHLKIDEKGKINNWVDGFFDQQELDLGEIFKLSRKK
jgi:predicted ATPase